jgi:membrane-bound lytic murein transglycosylase B
VPWYFLASINLVETRMGRIHGLSTAGAQGPMQFLPSTWAACCTGDIEDAHDAIVGAATYLKMRPDDMDSDPRLQPRHLYSTP